MKKELSLIHFTIFFFLIIAMMVAGIVLARHFFPPHIPNVYFTGDMTTPVAQSQDGLSVSASATVFTEPDVAMIDFGIESYNEDLRTAQTENAERMERITEIFQDLGVKEQHLQTSDYDVYTRYKERDDSWWSRNETQIPEIEYFRVSQNLTVRIEELEKIESIIASAVDEGVNSIGSIQFTLKDFADAREQAYEKAGNMIQKRAQNIANSMGVNAGRPLNISSHHEVHHPYLGRGRAQMQNVMFDSPAGMDFETGSISTGQIEVKVNIHARYSIEYEK